jgi:hypothetical protein
MNWKNKVGSGDRHPDFDETAARLKNLGWHDSKLDDIIITEDADGLPSLKLEVRFIKGWDKYQPAAVIFIDCAVVVLDLDLKAKQAVGGDISDAKCANTANSDLRARIKHDWGGGEIPVDEYIEFTIFLDQPAGEIRMLARDFDVRWAT